MLQDRLNKEEITACIEKWEQDIAAFHEGKAWELLEQIEGRDDQEFVVTYRAKLFAMLAYTRFQRTEQMDPLVERWVKEALKGDPTNVFSHRLKVEAFFTYLSNVPIPSKFSPIRETDHSAAKKKAATEYYEQATSFFEYIHSLEERYLAALESLEFVEDQELVKNLKQLVQLIEELKEQFQLILTTAGQYIDSVSSVYYSASQFNEIVTATRKITSIRETWIELLSEKWTTQQRKTALEELHEMVGLTDVKNRVKRLYQYLNYQKERIRQGFHSVDGINLHMILTGNPGTGKTHLARLIAKIYYELGLLERDEVYEVDRSQLVGAYVGQTEENTTKAIERAAGGVLFIDEAYSLKREGAAGNDYGQTAIDTLVSSMTSGKYAGTFAVILAGYPNEMRRFLRSNPGLRSRFPEQNQIEISNYSIEELLEIGEKVAIDNDYVLSTRAKQACRQRIEKAQVDESFGNARTVKNIVLDAIFHKGSTIKLEQTEAEDFVFLQAENFESKVDSKESQRAKYELEQLIGLEKVKKEIIHLTSFVEIQQLRREKGLQALPLQVHAVFTGNPGTGKTTVAKLYAKALNEMGLLKRGHLVVVSRADLVAGYVGQTAEKTKEKIKDALGGVLFIDEAYSLLTDGHGGFGKEAINTLVQEMTEHEENLVVVLAGYSKEMDQLLNSNPGLRSRFKKHVHFDDYSRDELVQMMEKRGEKIGYFFTNAAKEQLSEQLAEQGHPSNGRYAMDLFDRIVQAQALRLINQNDVNEEQLTILEKVDVENVQF
ncbi:hypothetical protein JCM9140_359 [Halalkalibacter wakoensis JCM 9140]|uniref:AAA+ ATPase domain-containing protein n=2 Tax=Halalkalibacter wakoensis TaxID=127891 RepID=W4PXJ1_9BACI|nr:hypothetical protein JCM9140_359 [Halalkalibacter wakoensis JCM 9140]